MDYEILVCPVCREQVEWSYEEGARCYHPEYGYDVEAVKAKVEPVGLEGVVGLGLFRLQEDKREAAFQLAERQWFGNLPKEEQERLETERRAKLSPMAQAMENVVEGWAADLRAALNEPPIFQGLSDAS